MSAQFNPSIKIVNNLFLGLATLAADVQSSQNKTSQYMVKLRCDANQKLFLWGQKQPKPLTENEIRLGLLNIKIILDQNLKEIKNSKLTGNMLDALLRTKTIFDTTMKRGNDVAITPVHLNILTRMIQGVKPHAVLSKEQELIDFETVVKSLDRLDDESSFLTLPLDHQDVAHFLTAPKKLVPTKSPNIKAKKECIDGAYESVASPTPAEISSVQKTKEKPPVVEPAAAVPEPVNVPVKPFVLKRIFTFYPKQIQVIANYQGEHEIAMTPSQKKLFTRALNIVTESGKEIDLKLSLESFRVCMQILASNNQEEALVGHQFSKEEIDLLIEKSQEKETSAHTILGEAFLEVQKNVGASEPQEHYTPLLTSKQIVAALELLD